jgi:hypothetical protein
MPRRIQVRLERRTQSEKPPGKTCWQGFNWRSSVDENDVINPRHLIDRAGNIGRAELIDAAKFASGPSATVQAIHSTARIRTFRGGKCQSVFENRQTVLLPGRMGHGTRKLIKNLSRSVPFPTTYKIAGRITDAGYNYLVALQPVNYFFSPIKRSREQLLVRDRQIEGDGKSVGSQCFEGRPFLR